MGDEDSTILAVGQGEQTKKTAKLLGSSMATSPSLIIFPFFQKQLIEGISLSGLK